jgi:hypothetical protein
MSAATWSDGAPRSQGNAFTGHTGAAPIVWFTSASASYATRVNAGLGAGNALDSAGRATVSIDPNHAYGTTIATAEDKKFKRKQGAAI